MAQTEAQKRAEAKYRERVRSFNLKFYPSHADLLEHFEKQEDKAAYLRELIRKDMKKSALSGCDLVDEWPEWMNRENRVPGLTYYRGVIRNDAERHVPTGCDPADGDLTPSNERQEIGRKCEPPHKAMIQVPFGYDLVDGELVINEKETDLVRRAYDEAATVEPDPETGLMPLSLISFDLEMEIRAAMHEKYKRGK